MQRLMIGVGGVIIMIDNTEIWHDCNEGYVDLDACSSGIKIQIKLLSGLIYNIDVLIWPHCAKINCDSQCGWVRTWQFLDRRWLAFSIKHPCFIYVRDMINQEISVSITHSTAALGGKIEKSTSVYMPALEFPGKRYFAPVENLDENETVPAYIIRVIWAQVEKFIPAMPSDIKYDRPHPVSDVRHQDAVLYYVKDLILNTVPPLMAENLSHDMKYKSEGKGLQFTLSGHSILAGIGRVVPFELEEVSYQENESAIVLMSAANLPTPNDEPVFFVNIDNLCDVPVKRLKEANVTGIFTSWRLGGEIHCSKVIPLPSISEEIKLNYHFAVPVPLDTGLKMLGKLMDDSFIIELRGIQTIETKNITPKLFGRDNNDTYLSKKIPINLDDEKPDILIAVCPIDAQRLALGRNGFIKGEFPLYPPRVKVDHLESTTVCTNGINGVRKQLNPKLLVPPHVILESQMTLDGSIGFVGPTPYDSEKCYSRFFCISNKERLTTNIINKIISINKSLSVSSRNEDMLTGFVCEFENLAFIFVEGPKDRHILLVWDEIAEMYTQTKVFFSTTARYFSRIYPEFLTSFEPFLSLKTYAPLGAMLACPPFYARPAIPVPCRIATLKLARILYGGLREPPCRSDMPSVEELRSFMLELTVEMREQK